MNLDIETNPGFKEAVISVRDLRLWRGLCSKSFG